MMWCQMKQETPVKWLCGTEKGKHKSKNRRTAGNWRINKYILLDILVCSIAVYFYESRRILASRKGESKYKCK